MLEEEARAGTDMAIAEYGITLAPVNSFKYLGRFLSMVDKYCPEVVHNLRRERQKW